MSWVKLHSNRSVAQVPQPDYVLDQLVPTSEVVSVPSPSTVREVQFHLEWLDGVDGNRVTGTPPGSMTIQPLTVNNDARSALNGPLVSVHDVEKTFDAYRDSCVRINGASFFTLRISAFADIPVGATHYNLWYQVF